jgi:hypothetical protein
MEQSIRKYPIGIQTFSEIIQGGYVYVDKTDKVWNIAHYAKFIFLSRPRRFGKSLLSSTLHSYFLGEKSLFQGLKIMSLEKEWKKYPVAHFDLSVAKHLDNAGVKEELGRQLERLESIYGRGDSDVTPGMRLDGIVRRAYEKTGSQVVVIIDEYDAPLLDVLHESERLSEMRETLQEFYQRLKMLEPFIKFCFITGVTKFSQLSIFSTINNLKNISLLPKFATICGFTEQEVRTVFKDDIQHMASLYDLSGEEMYDKIKQKYDGYHFAGRSEAVFNPFSLLNALGDEELNSYWFASGTPTFLIRQMKHFHTDITSLDYLEVPSTAFDQPTENMHDALPLLYQAGYLTIKAYDRETEMYTLAMPNQEVRVGYTRGLLPTYVGLSDADVQAGFAVKFWKALKSQDIDLAMRHLQAYLAGIPYVEGFKKKLAEAATKEGFYEYTFYLIFSMLNVYVRTQVKVAGGRIDVAIFMPDTIYIMELKVGESSKKALGQINGNGYAIPYLADGRQIVKVGIRFSTDKMTIADWTVER